jgi:hypothetical protein
MYEVIHPQTKELVRVNTVEEVAQILALEPLKKTRAKKQEAEQDAED